MSGVLVVAATEAELCGTGGLVCGVGPVEAAAAVARRLEQERPDALLHVGIAGARPGTGLEPLQLVVGESAVYEDLTTTRRLAPEVVRPDDRLLERVRAEFPKARVLPIGTTARVGGGAGCPVEAMEGFAVLRAAELARVAAIEVRAISNLVGDDRSAWRIADAIDVVRGALPRLLRALAS
jgi:futalosine hydrolase